MQVLIIIICKTFISFAQEKSNEKNLRYNLNPNEISVTRILNGIEIKPSYNVVKFERIIQIKDTLIIENEYSLLYDRALKIFLEETNNRIYKKDSRKLPLICDGKLINYEKEISKEFEALDFKTVKYINKSNALKNGFKNMPWGYLELK